MSVVSPYAVAVRAFKQRLVAHYLAVTGGNRAAAARALGVSRAVVTVLSREAGAPQRQPASTPRRLSHVQASAVRDLAHAMVPVKAVAAEFGLSVTAATIYARTRDSR